MKQKHNRTIWKAYKKGNVLREARGLKKLTYKQFENRVIARKVAEKVTLKTAVKKELHSHAYTSPEDIAKENFMSGIREKHNEAYKELRRMARTEEGRFKKVAESISWYESSKNGRKVSGFKIKSYDGKEYVIDVSNSPEEVELIEL